MSEAEFDPKALTRELCATQGLEGLCAVAGDTAAGVRACIAAHDPSERTRGYVEALCEALEHAAAHLASARARRSAAGEALLWHCHGLRVGDTVEAVTGRATRRRKMFIEGVFLPPYRRFTPSLCLWGPARLASGQPGKRREFTLVSLPHPLGGVVGEAQPSRWPSGLLLERAPRPECFAQWSAGALASRLRERDHEGAFDAGLSGELGAVEDAVRGAEAAPWGRTPEDERLVRSVRTALDEVAHLRFGGEQLDLCAALAERTHGVRLGSVVTVLTEQARAERVEVGAMYALGWEERERGGAYMLGVSGKRVRKDARVGVRHIEGTLACPVGEREMRSGARAQAPDPSSSP